MSDAAEARKALTDQVKAFMADPSGWPAAMGARAVRLATGHPPYSPTNQALIVCQLFGRYLDAGMSEDDALGAAVAAMSGEIAPAGVWKKRGYLPVTGTALRIWSRPIAVYVDPATGKRAFTKAKLEADKVESYSTYTVDRTYLATDVRNAAGEDGATAFGAPDLPAGHARDVFGMLSAWITAQGWRVERTGRDSAENGSTTHAAKLIQVHGGLTDWAAVETLAHEIAHALLHGDNDSRPYAGEHRGDMEAEAESVAFGVLTAFGQDELARGAARYAAEWTRSADRVAIAYERACHVTDALVRVALGEDDVTVRESAKAAKAAVKASNKELAAWMREHGLQPNGEAWAAAKAGERDLSKLRKLAGLIGAA